MTENNPSRFTIQNAEYLGEYLRDLQAVMRLQHWRVDILDVLPVNSEGEETKASCTIISNCNQAFLRFATPKDPQDLKESMIHELMHIHLDTLEDMVRSGIHAALNSQAQQVAHVQLHYDLEVTINNLTWVLLPFAPDPPLEIIGYDPELPPYRGY